MEIILGFLSDIANALSVPTSTITGLLKKFYSQKAKLLRDTIISEIGTGNFNNANKDDLIAVCHKLYIATMEGTAKKNLRLMVRVMKGMAIKNNLKTQIFLSYANILANLREDEIIALGIMAQYHPFSPEKPMHLRDRKIREKLGDKTESTQQSLLSTGLVTMKIETSSEQKQKPNLGRRSSSALIDIEPDFDIKNTTTCKYYLTPLMDEILEYTNHLF